MRNILEAQSISDLEKVGAVEFLTSKIEEAVSPLKVSANSYEELLVVITALKENWLPFAQKPFTNNRQKLIYYLLDHDGEKRNGLLGITDEMYQDPKAAKNWYKKIAQIIRADVNTDARSTQAFQELQEILSNLTDDADFGGDHE